MASACDQLRGRFDPLVVVRGDLYALRGAVTILEAGRDRVETVVRGTLPYEVSLRYEASRQFLLASCSCAHASRELCKHVWAALRVAERRGHLGDAAEGPALSIAARLQPTEEVPEREVRWVIDLARSSPWGEPVIEVFERGTTALGFSTGFRKVATTGTPAAEPMRAHDHAGAGSWSTLVELARGGRCEVRCGSGQETEPLRIDEGPPFRALLRIADAGGDAGGLPALTVEGELRRGHDRVPLSSLTAIFRGGAAFVGPRAIAVESDVPFRWVSALARGERLAIEEGETKAFLRALLHTCGRGSFELPPSIRLEEHARLTTRVHVRRPGAGAGAPPRKLEADVVFDYGGARIEWPATDRHAIDTARRRIVLRDPDAEARAIAELMASGFDRARRPPQRLKIPTAWLHRAVLALAPERFVVEADGVIHRAPTKKTATASSGIDWFELSAAVDYDGMVVPFPEILAAARRGDGRVRLDDGTVGLLPERWLARVLRAVGLATPPAEGHGKGAPVRFLREQLPLVDAILGGEDGGISWSGPLSGLRAELEAGSGAEAAPRPLRGFEGALRDYQRTGVAWMQWLERLGFSGCLADDMGLGKTVQVLALLADRKARGAAEGPSLVVAPRSVVYNWLDEARRFAPQLRVAEMSGATPLAESLATSDVLVATYGTLRGRAQALAATTLDYVILDEAHTIKNAASSAAQAARALRSRHRLALTGTPVENHLGELASLFDFLNPGMLGPRLRRAARRGIGVDPDAAAQLGRGLRPFVLRRRKAEVLRELPPRIEQTVACTMGSEQRLLYDSVKRRYQAELRGSRTHADEREAPFVALEALLRLRQIACHPGLVDPALRSARSAKLDVLHERLAPLASAGKKALVFSQFTALLDLVEGGLNGRGVAFARLDGATRDRRSVVQRFQTDPACLVFLVSLKAGGVGLNLTAAEVVFLLDPWWNPAAEAQAVDRAHRFGQTRTVMAYRLLCRDSIEERVAELQEKKRELVASVFGATEASGLEALARLSMADVEGLLA